MILRADAAPRHIPERTCIGCRAKVRQGDVIRCALAPEESGAVGGASVPRVVVDAERRIPGRGAWLHPDQSCWDQAVARKAFNRAFRRQVSLEHLSFEELESAGQTMACNQKLRDESGIREMDTR